MSKTATVVGVGKTFTITNTERNAGTTNMTAASNTIKFYLSPDNVITSADIPLTGTRTVAATALTAGASSVGTTAVTVPAATVPGTYFIGAIADATDLQIETNASGTGETNNARASISTLQVIP